MTTTVKDRLTGALYSIRCKYLIGADGGRSKVAEKIGLPLKGQMGLSGSMNILFDADLAKYVSHRPSVLYWILQPGANIGGIGAGVLRMVKPWCQWLAIWGYDISLGEMTLADEKAEEIVRGLIGDNNVPLSIRSTSTWTVNNLYAAQYSIARVFCVGDAVHRHPPSNGLGSNTSIQDAYNLAWKLKLVLEGSAHESLLETYSDERQPIGEQIVARANKSIEDYPPIFEQLGLLASGDTKDVNAAIQDRKSVTPEAKLRRRKLNEAFQKKNYEFNTHGVELNQRYRSGAVVSDGSPEPEYAKDPELYYHATTWPGAHLPHVWVEHEKSCKSTLDLCGRGVFTLLTGIGGEVWREAVLGVERRFGISVRVVSIGPSGCDALDIYADWYWQSEVEEEGCVLVRPDCHVGWRARTVTPDAGARLVEAFANILGWNGRRAEGASDRAIAGAFQFNKS
jgi:2,4-dichlorophenol 6-monooxygenase